MWGIISFEGAFSTIIVIGHEAVHGIRRIDGFPEPCDNRIGFIVAVHPDEIGFCELIDGNLMIAFQLCQSYGFDGRFDGHTETISRCVHEHSEKLSFIQDAIMGQSSI